MHKTKGKFLLALLITSMIAFALSVHPSYAIPSIYLMPDSIVNETWTPGTVFNITAYVDASPDVGVAGFQVDVMYDSSILDATGAWLPYWDPQYIFYGKNTVKPAPYFLPNEVQVGDLTLPFTGVTFTTEKLLAIIQFEVLSVGRSTLPDDNAGTYLLNSDADEIPILKKGSYFDNRPPIQPATVFLDPFKVADPLLTPSHTFDVNVKIINATDLNSFQFKLSYDSTILNVTNAKLGSFFTGTPTINYGVGLLTFSALKTPQAPVSGNGTLAIITFHVEGIGRSDLNLHDVSLSDKDGNPLPIVDPIPHNPGSFNNVLLAKLYVDPPEIIDPTLHPGSTVNINITIDDVESMYGYEFKLGYDPDVLTALGGWVYRVQNEGNFTVQLSFDDILGVVWANVTYYPPATPITTFTPAALVTVIFQIDGYGTSILHLYDTRIVDDLGQPIRHETTDGFIQTVIRDVAIISVVPSTNWAYPGWPVDITVVAKNKGMMIESFNVKAFYENNLIGTKPVTNLAPGAEETLVFTWDTTGVPGGTYTLKAEASTVPYETNTADNVKIDGSVEIRSIYRDVAVTNVVPERSWAYQTWKVNITVTAKNLGNISETFDVNATYDDHLIGTKTVINLPASSEISWNFTWNTASVTPGNYILKGVAELVPFEYNPANNVYIDGAIQIRLLGDTNGDGKVDIKDLAFIALGFGSYVGHPRYNPDADLNQDGRIDIKDLAACAKNFGKSV